MIYLSLGEEPVELTRERATRLPAAVEAWNLWSAAPDPSDARTELEKSFKRKIIGYEAAADALHARQHRKCAYCERKLGRRGEPTEHVRPKLGVAAEPGATTGRDATRYWWLAWTWTNLVFACSTCNCQSNKGNRFPLKDETTRIQAPSAPAALPLPVACYDTQAEQRLFVHPRLDDPLSHLEWAPVDRAAPPTTWRIDVVGRTETGEKTRDVLELTAVVADIQTHFDACLWPWVDELNQALTDTDLARVKFIWKGLCERLVIAPDQPFRGATFWILCHLHSVLGLEQHGCVTPPRPEVR